MPKEPIAAMLKHIKVTKPHVNLQLLQRMVDYQLFDLERGDMQSVKELEVYAENTRSLMLYLQLHLLGVDDHNATLAASHVGRSLGICDVLKKTPYYIAVGRRYLP